MRIKNFKERLSFKFFLCRMCKKSNVFRLLINSSCMRIIRLFITIIKQLVDSKYTFASNAFSPIAQREGAHEYEK